MENEILQGIWVPQASFLSSKLKNVQQNNFFLLIEEKFSEELIIFEVRSSPKHFPRPTLFLSQKNVTNNITLLYSKK